MPGGSWTSSQLRIFRTSASNVRSSRNLAAISCSSPREGGHLIRLYVDLGDVGPDHRDAVRQTTVEQTIAKAEKILHPHKLDVRQVAWYSVYEVGHGVCERFDDVPLAEVGTRVPRVFIAGNVGHTHSAKAGQGMNVSMQDGFNLGGKLAHVLLRCSSESLLATYSAERKAIGEDIIRFDQWWAAVMAKSPQEFDHPSDFEDAYLQITEFAQVFMAQYAPSMIVAEPDFQILATGFPIGKRFKSAVAPRVVDVNVIYIGHESKANDRWCLFVFADSAQAGEASPTAALAEWLAHSPKSPVHTTTPPTADENGWFNIKVIHQQAQTDVALSRVPATYMPRVGRFGLINYDGVFAAAPGSDIFEQRSIDRGGAIFLVWPDQYVANILPLTATAELAEVARRFTLTQW